MHVVGNVWLKCWCAVKALGLLMSTLITIFWNVLPCVACIRLPTASLNGNSLLNMKQFCTARNRLAWQPGIGWWQLERQLMVWKDRQGLHGLAIQAAALISEHPLTQLQVKNSENTLGSPERRGGWETHTIRTWRWQHQPQDYTSYMLVWQAV